MIKTTIITQWQEEVPKHKNTLKSTLREGKIAITKNYISQNGASESKTNHWTKIEAIKQSKWVNGVAYVTKAAIILQNVNTKKTF